jgi:hypothetical protein
MKVQHKGKKSVRFLSLDMVTRFNSILVSAVQVGGTWPVNLCCRLAHHHDNRFSTIFWYVESHRGLFVLVKPE